MIKNFYDIIIEVIIMNVNEIEVLYDGIFLERVKLKKEYDIHEIIRLLKDNDVINNNASINLLNLQSNMLFQINFKEKWVLTKALNYFNIKLNDLSLKIIRFVNVLYSLYDNNYQVIDNHIIKNKQVLLVNYTESIAYRNYIISKQFLINILNQKDLLLCYYSIRDIIENVKVYLYLLRGAIKEEITQSKNGIIIKHITNNEVKKEIHSKLENENSSWNLNIKDLVKRNPTLKPWSKELIEINKINEKCNNYIHKNGFTKISPRYINENNDNELLENWFKIIKFYFTITILYDGKSMENSEYMDYLENGEEPPEDCQNWMAPIFQEFVDLEYNAAEKKEIINQSDINIK